jgi:3-hydroxyisobutyrate dehydrogenase-like beta-hydroxyacid dehydrogenase
MKVSVLGLGEAGSLFAADLVRAGAEVVAFDPADVATPDGVRRVAVATSVATEATLILTLTAASDAAGALDQILGFVPRGAVYADLGTGSPGLKRQLAASQSVATCASPTWR